MKIFIKLQTLASEIWNERKAIDYIHAVRDQKRRIEKIKMLRIDMGKALEELDKELIFLEDFTLIKNKQDG